MKKDRKLQVSAKLEGSSVRTPWSSFQRSTFSSVRDRKSHLLARLFFSLFLKLKFYALKQTSAAVINFFDVCITTSLQNSFSLFLLAPQVTSQGCIDEC